MKLKLLAYFRWISNTPYRSINRAYNLGKKIRNIHIHYMWYKYNQPIESRNLKIITYIDIVLQEYASKIYWTLLEFKISKIIRNILIYIGMIEITNQNKLKIKNYILPSLKKKVKRFFFNSNQLKQNSIDNFNKKIIWIESVLNDLTIKKNTFFFYSIKNIIPSSNINIDSIPSNNVLQIIPYESVGLVPRSITRTLGRFQNELLSFSPFIVLAEFRLVKYQAIASLQYLMYLIIGPWVISEINKILILEPVIMNFWNTSQYHIFINFSQEEEALTRLQKIEELVWLDIILSHTSDLPLQDLSISIHKKTLELVTLYNQHSIDTIINLFKDGIQFIFLFCLLIWGKQRLAILNSWIQEVFYSLSDTMKAFFILLCTDLCIGFHSPHGWEILISSLLEHLSLSQNAYTVSCLVSTFPVILDTVFKYWIFRHLNRISPSIVVTYHTMNE